MSYIGHAVLDSQKIQTIALDLLRKRLKPFGFSGLTVTAEKDFDDENILRLIADVKQIVPASDLIEATSETMNALRKQGDDRFVYLTAVPATDDLEDAEE
ncbi:hypothetical protein [uncultured Devosia sp.]|uniref:hypothetical protein n=1 Tax=uncultured Devosia sp. TaxID=211434 RepID=UPI0035CA6B39